MRVGQQGLALIRKFEGCKLQTYKCSAGVNTIGFGHTNGVKPGTVITSEQAEQFLKEDLSPIEEALSNKFPNLNQLMFDALVSFSFNVGLGWLRKGSGLRDALTKKDYTEAASQLLRWDKVQGKPCPGLTTRRSAERDLFIEGYHRGLEL